MSKVNNVSFASKVRTGIMTLNSFVGETAFVRLRNSRILLHFVYHTKRARLFRRRSSQMSSIALRYLLSDTGAKVLLSETNNLETINVLDRAFSGEDGASRSRSPSGWSATSSSVKRSSRDRVATDRSKIPRKRGCVQTVQIGRAHV